VTAAVPSIPLSALLDLFASTAIARKNPAETGSPAGAAGGSAGPAAGSSAFQLLLGSPSDPPDTSLMTPRAKVRVNPVSAAATRAESSGSSSRKPVPAAAPQSPASAAVPFESVPFPATQKAAGWRFAAANTEQAAAGRIPLAGSGTEVAGNSAIASPLLVS